MLNVTYKLFMLSVVLLTVVVLNVVMLSVTYKLFMLRVVMLNVVMLSVVTPKIPYTKTPSLSLNHILSLFGYFALKIKWKLRFHKIANCSRLRIQFSPKILLLVNAKTLYHQMLD